MDSLEREMVVANALQDMGFLSRNPFMSVVEEYDYEYEYSDDEE